MSRIFAVPDGMHSDAHPDYEAGRIDQLDADERKARILAFGAIRRAAEVARDHDRECLAALARNKELICERHEENAHECRRAIRAAIRSDKS